MSGSEPRRLLDAIARIAETVHKMDMARWDANSINALAGRAYFDLGELEREATAVLAELAERPVNCP